MLGHVPDEVAVARAGVGAGEVEAAQPRVDRAAPGAGEDVDARAGRLEQERVGQAGAAGLGLVALGPLGFEPPDGLVVAVGGRLRRPQRVAAGMGRFVEERRVVDPARFPVERGVGGAGERDRRLRAVGRVDAGDHDARERAGRSGELSTVCASRFSAKVLPAPPGPAIAARNGVCDLAATQSCASG